LAYLILLRPPLARRKHDFLNNRASGENTGILVAFRRGLKRGRLCRRPNALGITGPISLLGPSRRGDSNEL